MQTIQKTENTNNSNLKNTKIANTNLNGSLNHNNSAFFKDINNFFYSKKNHLEFFRNNNYDVELLGKKTDYRNCDIDEYQNLLVYSFIKQCIPAGSRILEIGDSGSIIFKKIKNNYECWEIRDTEELNRQSYSSDQKIKIKKFENEHLLSKNSHNYFDFVFSNSAFEKIPYNESGTVYNNIIYNLNRFSKPGGYEIHSFAFYLTDESFKVNNFFYYFFKDNYSSNKTLNNYTELKSISTDTNVYYSEKSSSDSNYIKLRKKFLNKKIKTVSYNFIQKKIPQLPKITSSTRSYFLQKTPVYIFHHLMKCGGTSMAVSLKKWFILEDEFMYKPGDMNNFEINTFIKYKLNVDNLISDTCIRGHYHDDGYYLHQRYPEAFLPDNNFKIFTFIRDPLQVRISLYYYLMNLGIYYKDMSLEHSLRGYNNFIASRFPCDKTNYKEILDRYFFVGIVERMQESFDKLAAILNKRKIKLLRVNTSTKDSKAVQLSSDFLKKFKEDNELDYLIYNYCLEKFNKI